MNLSTHLRRSRIPRKGSCLDCAFAAAILLFWLSMIGTSNAAPTLTGCSPFILAKGETTTVKLSGKDLKASSLYFTVSGVTAKLTKDNTFEVTVANHCPPVDCDVWVIEADGTAVSGPVRIRIVGKAPVFLEKEPNDGVGTAQQVELPCYVAAGFQKSAERDRFRFSGKAGQLVTIVASSKELESKAVPKIALQSANGQELGFGSEGSDLTLLTCRLPADDSYIVTVHDSAYRAAQPAHYCLQIAMPQFVVSSRTSVVAKTTQMRTTEPLKFIGFGVSPQVQSAERVSGSLPARNSIELSERTFGPGEWSLYPSRYRYADALLRNVVTAFSDQERLGVLTVSRLPIHRSASVLSTKTKPESLQLPAHVSRAFDRPAKTDWYSFAASKGEPIAIDAWGSRLGHKMDLEFYLFDEQGKQVAKGDDTSTPKALTGLVDVASMDPSLIWSPPKSGNYSLAIRDLFGSSLFGSDRFYELTLAKPDANETVFMLPKVSAGQGLTLKRGGKLELPIAIWRVGKAQQSATVRLANQKPGISAEPLVLKPGVTKSKLVIKASAKAELGLASLRFAASIKTKSGKMRM